ncbi:MAG TPA: hypothetical protein DCK99_08750 [Blastocatellia bacterium]|nr:hypothetical protein [Blastocatellia bacterium]
MRWARPPARCTGFRRSSEWISKGYYGLDQGPIILMIENYRSGFLWRLMRRGPYIIDGLCRAGFSGGWLRDGTSTE